MAVDGSGLLILPLVNTFHDGLRTVLLCGWQRIAHSYTHQWLSRRFSRHISQQMAADCSFFLSSIVFTMVCTPYCSADGRGLLILPLVKCFHDRLRTVLLSSWQRIAHSSARQRLFRRFVRRLALRMTANCWYFRWLKALTMDCAPDCSADGSALLIFPLVNGLSSGLRAVLLSGWQHIAHTSVRQRLSQPIARRIAQRMATHCLYLRSSMAFTTV